MSDRKNTSERLPWMLRLGLILGGGVLLVLLITAARLTPDPRGYGTHQGLGLPPCSLQMLVGWRCPSCGMTTSWAHLMRGRILSSLESNVGGTLLALVALFSGPWALVSGLRGRWIVRPPSEWTTAAVAIFVLAVTLLDWAVRCWTA